MNSIPSNTLINIYFYSASGLRFETVGPHYVAILFLLKVLLAYNFR